MRGIFAYGGCVTRDSFEAIEADYSLVGYVARQSLISAAHQPISVPNHAFQLNSRFQQRQLRGDIESSLFPSLRDALPQCDAVILDLVVERFGVRKYQDGFLTRTNELARSQLGGSLTSAHPAIRFATDRHFKLWSYGARQLFNVLEGEDALGRTVVFETPWASRTRNGVELAGFRNHTSDEMNVLYRPYYEYLRELGIRVERFPDAVVLSDDNHQWGPAPYHYIPEAYEWMAGIVRDIPPRETRPIHSPGSENHSQSH